ncbi:hypothetical protein KW800_03075 [Candidatus Parcubacteria bacterium]|nr:hypothetical protein [Candidatus Parcubacteria bacterium]
MSPDSFLVYTGNQAFANARVSICDTLGECARGTFGDVESESSNSHLLIKAPSRRMAKFRLYVRYADGRHSSFTVRHNSTDKTLWIYLHIHGPDNAPNWPAVSPGFIGFSEVYPDGMTPGPCKSFMECDYAK